MNLTKNEIIKLSITNLAFGGKGVAKIKTGLGEYFVIFVENAIPGDIVAVKIAKIKKNYAEGIIETIISPSSDRIKPRCKHFGICGGCSLQHLPYEQQLQWKQNFVADCFAKIGGFENVAIEPIMGCENPWFYRNKMEYSFGEQNEQKIALGLHPRQNYREVFDMEECFLESEISQKIFLAVKKWTQEKRLSSFNPRKNSGLLRNLIIREGKNTNRIMMNIVTVGEEYFLEQEFAQFMRQSFPNVTSIYRTSVKIQKGHRTELKETLLYGEKTLQETLTVPVSADKSITLIFDILPQAFFQPNTSQAQILYGKILEFSTPQPQDTVLDLFCGTGAIGMFFAQCVSSVIGVELNPSAIETAAGNATNNSILNIKFLCADIFKFLHSLPSTLHPLPSILITDPPRSGIAKKALDKIIALKIPKWIYVSCNPATLSRDLKNICASGYKLEKIQPIDMFPQTFHVEIVCFLTY